MSFYTPTLVLVLDDTDTTLQMQQLLQKRAESLLSSITTHQKLLDAARTTLLEIRSPTDNVEFVIQANSVRFFYTLHYSAGYEEVEDAAVRLKRTIVDLGYKIRHSEPALGRPSGKVPALVTSFYLEAAHKLPFALILEGTVPGDSKKLDYTVSDYSSNQPMWTVFSR